MAKKKSPLKIAQEKAETAIKKTNDRIDFLGEKTPAKLVFDEFTKHANINIVKNNLFIL